MFVPCNLILYYIILYYIILYYIILYYIILYYIILYYIILYYIVLSCIPHLLDSLSTSNTGRNLNTEIVIIFLVTEFISCDIVC